MTKTMSLEDYRVNVVKKSYYRFGQEDLNMRTLNPGCMTQRWCLKGDKKYHTLPPVEMMIKIQDEVTGGKVTIERMVRDLANAKKGKNV